VYRQARRAAFAILPVAAVFVVWDVLAIAGRVWTYNPSYLSLLELPGNIPLEEVLFFLVIPLCGLLTYNAVDTILSYLHKRRTRSERSS